MQYRILKDFKGSPDGTFAVQYLAGTIVDLTPSLAAVAVAEGWAEAVEEPATEPAPAGTKRKKH